MCLSWEEWYEALQTLKFIPTQQIHIARLCPSTESSILPNFMIIKHVKCVTVIAQLYNCDESYNYTTTKPVLPDKDITYKNE